MFSVNTLRGRLTAWFLTSVGFIILIFLSAVALLFYVTIQNQIDHHVHIAVSEAHQIVQNYQGSERDSLIRSLVSARGMTVVVLAPDGSPILETNSPDIALSTEHQLQKILTAQNLYQSAPTHFTESHTRFAAMPVQVQAGKGIVAVGYSTQVIYDSFLILLAIVSGVIVLLILPLSFLGSHKLRQELVPLERISQQAKQISASSLSSRIHLSSPTIELKNIQEALNLMLGRLEEIFSREREFFADAAHTLKTPLAVIRFQMENIKQNPQIKKDLLLSLDSAGNTIQDLLFLSCVATLHHDLKNTSLSKLLIELADLTQTLGEEKHLEIITDIPKDVTHKTNPQLLTKALTNILHNAVIYNKSNGKIYITLKKKNDKIFIAIKDTGIGIPKKDLPHVFDRFYRGKSDSKGSGLGLAITKSVIESLGGKISITSHFRQDTAFTVTF